MSPGLVFRFNQIGRFELLSSAEKDNATHNHKGIACNLYPEGLGRG